MSVLFLITFSINLSRGFREPFRNPRTAWIGYEKVVEEKLRALRGRSTPGVND